MKLSKRKALAIIGPLIYSGAVAAAPASGPSWETIAIGTVGLLITGVGWYARGVSGRVEKLEGKISDINTIMLREYHPKQDVKEMMDDVKESLSLMRVEVKASFKELQDRMDKFEGLYGR